MEILIYIIAGLGAGFATGLAGLSAAAIISPMLISLLGFSAYEAISISLAADVLASAISAFTYKKGKNIDIKNGLLMAITTVIFTIICSYLAKFLPQSRMGTVSIWATLFIGLRFVFRPISKSSDANLNRSKNKKRLYSIILGAIIGSICGILGAGGGLMMLFVLTSILGYDLKTAVGTSVLIMSFTALAGSVTHFAVGGIPNLTALIYCLIFTFIGAFIASIFANKANIKKVNRVTGVVLVCLGVGMLIFKYLSI